MAAPATLFPMMDSIHPATGELIAQFEPTVVVDADRLPSRPKSWWYGYDEHLGAAADRFLEFLFAPEWRLRLRSARGAMRAVFRGHRI